MTSNTAIMNIPSQVDRVFVTRTPRWRQDFLAEFYVTKNPTVTMESLYEKYTHVTGSKKRSKKKRLQILKQMHNVFVTESMLGPVETKDEIDEEERLRDFVFRYYRTSFNKELNSDHTILLHEAFQLMHLVYEDPDDIDLRNRWINLIVGATQSGKTFLLVALSHIFVALGYDSIFIIKDVSQVTQFKDRRDADAHELQTALAEKGFSKKSIELFNEPLYHDSNTGDKAQFMNELEATLNRTRRRSIMCIHHYAHFDRILEKVTPNSKVVIFVDEAHKLGAYKKVAKKFADGEYDSHHTHKQCKVCPEFRACSQCHKDEEKDTPNTKCMICGVCHRCREGKKSHDESYLRLKPVGSKIFLFTATAQPILIAEPDLYSDSIVLLPEGKDYRGIESWSYHLIPSRKEEKYSEIKGFGIKNKPCVSKVPNSFLQVLAGLSDHEPIKRINRFGVKDRLPINVMAKFESTNDGQHMLLQSMKPGAKALNTDHQKIIDSKWCVIVFNMLGIRLYDDHLRCKSITLKLESPDGEETDYTVVDGTGTGEFLFDRRKVQIEDVWHWLGTNGGAANFPHIVTFTYRSAEEGITFSSKWGPDADSCVNWHLTDIYSRLGSSASSASAEQSTGRLNGNHGDTDRKGLPVTARVWCSIAEKEKTIKSVNLHRQMLKDICDLKFHARDGRVIEHINNYKVFANRVPKNYYGDISGAQDTIKKVRNPHAKVEDESFTRHKKALSTMQMLNPGLDGGKRRERNLDRKVIELTREIYPHNFENKKDEGDGDTGYVIERASLTTTEGNHYDVLLKHLSSRKIRGQWIPLSTLRKLFKNGTKIHLMDQKKDYSVGAKGLLWRQPGGLGAKIEFCYKS